MIVALGKGVTDEYRDNLHKVNTISIVIISHLFFKRKKALAIFYLCLGQQAITRRSGNSVHK